MMIVPRLKQASKNLKAAVHKAKNKWIKFLCASLNTNIETKSTWDGINALQRGLSNQTILYQADETLRWFFMQNSNRKL